MNSEVLNLLGIKIEKRDEYIAVIDAKKYASDTECFVPLMEKFNDTYGHYPKYPVADTGYGSYNNYIYCKEHSMEKFMKFTMFEKKTKDKKYRDNPYRAVNFSRYEDGDLVCPNGKSLHLNMKRKSEKINMEEQKKYMNVRIVKVVRIEANAVKELNQIVL